MEDVFAMLVLALAYDNYKGRLGIGKIFSGSCKKNQNALLAKMDGTKIINKISSLQMYQGLKQVDVEEAVAGDIVAIGGFDDIHIGDTLTDPINPKILPPVEIEPPTIKMTFGVNTSPFAGSEGKFVTSRQLRERLIKELETNVALKVEPAWNRAVIPFWFPDAANCIWRFWWKQCGAKVLNCRFPSRKLFITIKKTAVHHARLPSETAAWQPLTSAGQGEGCVERSNWSPTKLSP